MGTSSVPQRQYTDFSEINRPEEHFDILHSNADGAVLLWDKIISDWYKLWGNDPKIPRILSLQIGQLDRFISVNQFEGWRKIRLLRSLRAMYCDIDGCNDLSTVLDALQSHKLPKPSFIVWSGRGIHLYWLHNAVPASALPVWQRCQNAINLALQGIGADPLAKDCTRVLRLVGSINSKNNETVKGLILNPVPYQFHFLCDEILGPRPQRKSADVFSFPRKRKKRSKKHSIYAWWYLVWSDLVRIAEHHKRIPEGYRNNWLFLYATAMTWFCDQDNLPDQLESDTRELVTGLTDAEVRAAIKMPLERAEMARQGLTIEWEGQKRNPRLFFKRKTLWAWMQGIIPAELLPNLRAIIPDYLHAERKRENDKKAQECRWNDRYTKEGVRASNENKRASARLMKAKGMSIRAIAAALGVGKSTVARWTVD